MGQNHTPFVKGKKLDTSKLKREKVFLGPEHGPGVYVLVRGFSVQESEAQNANMQALTDAGKSEEARKNAGYEILAVSLVNEDGTQMFAGADKQSDIVWRGLDSISPAALEVKDGFDVSVADFIKIIDKVNELNGANKDRAKN